MRVIISGGGTGGHIYPAIAIAEAILKKSPDSEILFVGANGKMEMEKVPQAGFEIVGLDVVGFHRQRMWRNIGFPFKLFKSLRQAKKIIEKFKTDVAVGVGGYASGPLLIQAQRKGIPTIIQEQNSYPGITNKWLSKRAKIICVAYPNMDRFFSADKIIETGNPIRNKLNPKNTDDKKNAYEYFKMNSNKTTTLIIGGSLGAKSINQALERNTAYLNQYDDVQYIWQCGKLYHSGLLDTDSAKLDNVTMLPFIERMDYAYAIADIVIARSGALTVSELANLSKSSILIPSPNVAEDHQTKNAMALVNAGAALMVSDKEIDLWTKVHRDLVDNPVKREKLSTAIKSFAKPKAAGKIADMVLAIAKGD